MSGQAETQPDVRGFIDGLTGDQIDGWAFEPAHPTERVVVELRLDGRAVATTVADRHRTDLVRAGIGDGFHGFRFTLKPAWAERRSDLAAVARGLEGGESPLQIFRRPAAEPRPAAVSTAAPAAASPQVIKAIEQLVAGQRALEQRLQDVANRAPAEASVPASEETEQRIAVLEAWVARLDERLGALQSAAPAPRVGRKGPDTWQVVLMALLGMTSFGALAAFALILAL